MKRFIAVMLLLCLPALALAQDVAPLSKEDLIFTLRDTPFELGCAAKPLIDLATEHKGSLTAEEAPSCLFFGKDREYTNEGFLIATVPSQPDGSDSVESITVFCEDCATARGVKVGMSRQDVIAAYGEGYTLDYDQMDYALEPDDLLSPKLSFFLDLSTDTVVSYMLLSNTTKGE